MRAARLILPLTMGLAVAVSIARSTVAAPTPGGPAGAVLPTDEGRRSGNAPHGHGGIGEFNLYFGVLGEREGAEPGLLWRPPGMQPPFLATLLNYGALFFLLYHYGRRPIANALKKRRRTIMSGMDEAARMRDEAAARLAGYERKLERIKDEVERVKRDMAEASDRERERILAEAEARRERMEHDAKVLIGQELKEARLRLHRETVRSAIDSAREALERGVGGSDQQRLADEYLAGLKEALESTRVGRA